MTSDRATFLRRAALTLGALALGKLPQSAADPSTSLNGTWLHEDAGTLELGVVRDSLLNQTADYRIFAETFENVAFVGVESYVFQSIDSAS